ncbi:MAG: hypothetical protein WKF36_10115 [Candidatus Nitrosocosmicus sp.]
MIVTNIVDGIVAGLVSTCLMTIFEIPFWRIWGIEGVLEWHENQILTSKLKRKFTKDEHNAVSYTEILILHVINGVLASIIFPFVSIFFISIFFINDYSLSIMLGIVYGTLLWTMTLLLIHKPITGLSVWNHPLGRGPAIVSFCGHIVYGITLGALIKILL